MGLCFSGDAVRFPNIRWIWSHGRGTLPFLAARIAGATNIGVISSLKQLVGPDHILFGTDFPPEAES